jgi:predicted metal-dependent HD superfamily phosphohydrolase
MGAGLSRILPELRNPASSLIRIACAHPLWRRAIRYESSLRCGLFTTIPGAGPSIRRPPSQSEIRDLQGMHPAISAAFETEVQDPQVRASLLPAIEAAYAAPERHYHNLRHLDHLARELESVRGQVADWNLLMLAAAYHDVVYDTARPDNEEASASRAVVELQPFLKPERIDKLRDIILGTKQHESFADADTNLFCDADLAILGAVPEVYDSYAAQIRREYSRYPDELYHTGRAAVLRKLLEQPELFKSAHFHQRYASAAKANILRELSR